MTAPDILKYVSAVTFGAAVSCLFLMGRRLAAVGGRAAGPASTSLRRAEMRDLAVQQSPVFRIVLPSLGLIAEAINPLDIDGLRTYVRGPYVQAGYPGGLDDDEVIALGIFISVGAALFIGFSAAVLLGPGAALVGLLGLPVGFLLLVTSLKSRAAARELQILQALPYVLDLMVLMLRSGTSLRIALTRVIEDYRYHPIGVEFGQVLAEMDVGGDRAESFRRLADRLKIPDLTSLTDAIAQSEELGWPLAETLERLADRLSSERMLQAEAKAGAAGVLVMIPSTLVLAAAVLLLFSPFIVKFLRSGSILD